MHLIKSPHQKTCWDEIDGFGRRFHYSNWVQYSQTRYYNIVEPDVNVTSCDVYSFFNQWPPHQKRHQQRPHHITQRPHPRPTSEHSTHPSPAQTTTTHHNAKWGRMPRNNTSCRPWRPMKGNGRPQTLTPPPPHSIDNDECPGTTPTTHHQDPRTRTCVHKHWQKCSHYHARSTTATTTDKPRASPPATNGKSWQWPPPPTRYQRCSLRLAMNGKPQNDHRTTAHNPGKATGDEERPSQPSTNDAGHPQMQTTTPPPH